MSGPSRGPRPATDGEVRAFLGALALRFDGYRHAESRGRADPLADWSGRFVRTFRMAEDPNEDHAACFALQRDLCKRGGEMPSDRSREHLAYRLPFLHRAAGPPGFALDRIPGEF